LRIFFLVTNLIQLTTNIAWQQYDQAKYLSSDDVLFISCHNLTVLDTFNIKDFSSMLQGICHFSISGESHIKTEFSMAFMWLSEES